MRRWLIIVIILIFSTSGYAATITGTVYNQQLEEEKDVLIEVNSLPIQKYLSKDGDYQFNLPIGTYTITARKGSITSSENIAIAQEGIFVVDLFLLPNFADEDDLWADTNDEIIEDDLIEQNNLWIYGMIIILAVFFFLNYKYKLLNKIMPQKPYPIPKPEEPLPEAKTTTESSPYLMNMIEILKKNEGRMTQKELRKEMVHLSEAKISLIITELEHKGKVKRIKQGRGNIIILKTEGNFMGGTK